jgi:hypothetical protein
MRNRRVSAALLMAAIVPAGAVVMSAAAAWADPTYQPAQQAVPAAPVEVGYSDQNGHVLPTSGANPLPVAAGGSTGADYSANKPALPNVGANFGSSGPYASYVLIATVAASPMRNNVDIENDSGAQIAIVRDDGTASSGSAPNNASVFALSGGTGTGVQGGAWVSTTFKGRLEIYAPSTSAQVAVMVD